MTVKPQPTLHGYNAWVIRRLVEVRGTSPAEVAAWILDHWIDDNDELLEQRYGIRREDFLRRENVVPIGSGRP